MTTDWNQSPTEARRFCTGDSIFNLINYTVIVQSSQFNKNLGLQFKNLAGNSFPGRSTQWWLTNRVRRTSLALWVGLNELVGLACTPGELTGFDADGSEAWARVRAAGSSCWCLMSAEELRPLSWDGSSSRLSWWSALVGVWCQPESRDHCHGTDHHHGWWLTGPEF